MKKYLIIGFAALALAVASSRDADASFVLAIDNGDNGSVEIVVVDNAAAGAATDNVGLSTDADTDPTVGVIQISKAIGVWFVQVSIAATKPAVSGAPQVHLTVVVISSGAGTIRIGATDTSFANPGPLAGIVTSIGGTTNGTVSARGEAAYAGANANKEFSGGFGPAGGGTPDAVVTQGPLGPGAYSGTVLANAAPVTPFSLTNYVKITHTGAGQLSSADHTVAINPEPGSLAIFGGLSVLGAMFLRRRKNAA
jgi:hypothetical protein